MMPRTSHSIRRFNPPSCSAYISLPDPLKRNFRWWINRPLDLKTLNDLSQLLIGEHDFKSFQSTGSEIKSTVRKITTSEWQNQGGELLYTIEGNGFLKQFTDAVSGLAGNQKDGLMPPL